jgi:hypothetical protein
MKTTTPIHAIGVHRNGKPFDVVFECPIDPTDGHARVPMKLMFLCSFVCDIEAEAILKSRDGSYIPSIGAQEVDALWLYDFGYRRHMT